MDQVKLILKKIKKHHFWIICGLVVLLGLYFWWSATSHLMAEKGQEQGTIDQEFSAMRQLSGVPLHPNPEYEKEQGDINDAAAIAIRDAWQARYDRQVDLLVWPTRLGQNWIRKVNTLRPIEPKVEWIPDDSRVLNATERDHYKFFIEDELPKLAETVGAVWQPEAAVQHSGGAGGHGGNAARTPEAANALVIWDPSNQQALTQNHFRWPDMPGGTPSLLHVLYAQEDLWVLEAITEIIAKTNEGANAPHKAVIREIKEISIGRSAGEPLGTLVEPIATDTGGDGPDQGGDAERTMPGPAPPPTPFADGTAPGGPGGPGRSSGAGQDPGEGRYVDRDYVSLTATELRESIDSDDPEQAYLAVAKRMPVRMRFTMDQRGIPRLLLACANSPLTVEVRQVLVDSQKFPGDPGTADAIETRPQGVAPGVPGLLRPQPKPGTGPMRGEGGGSGGSQRLYDVEVEIYGIIYVYNDVNWDKLKVDAATLEQQGYTGGDAGDTAP